MPQALRRADWAERRESAVRPAAVPFTLQSFVLRPHSTNCSMPWVSLDSISRSGGIALQDPAVNERNEGNVSSQHQPEGTTALSPTPSFQLFLTLLRSPSPQMPSSLSILSENCSTSQQVTRRDEWGQLLLTTAWPNTWDC